MVSIPLKISQNRNLPQVEAKTKNLWNHRSCRSHRVGAIESQATYCFTCPRSTTWHCKLVRNVKCLKPPPIVLMLFLYHQRGTSRRLLIKIRESRVCFLEKRSIWKKAWKLTNANGKSNQLKMHFMLENDDFPASHVSFRGCILWKWMARNSICSFTFHKMIVTFSFRPSHYLDAHIFWEPTNAFLSGWFSGFPTWLHMWIKLFSQSLWFKHGDLQDEVSQSLWGSMVDHDCFICLLIWGGSKDKEVNGEC